MPDQPVPPPEPPKPQKMENHERVERSFGRMIINNFFGGVAWSLGVLIGSLIVVGIAAYFLKQINLVPIFGHFMSEVLKSAQSNLQPASVPQ